MKAIGRVLSPVAAVVLRKKWAEVRRRLVPFYHRYLETLAPQIPEVLTQALIAAEDRRFYGHGGIDPRALARVLWRALAERKLEGASTLEQQLVRTVTARYEKSLRRKLAEVMLASLLYRVVPKRDLPGLYLSIAYFGWRMNGLLQACRRLNISLGEMTLNEAAAVVARLKYPEPSKPSLRRAAQIALREKYVCSLILQQQRKVGSGQIEKEAMDATLPDLRRFTSPQSPVSGG